MACLEKPALLVCVLLIRGKLVAFYVFSLAYFTTAGQKDGQWLTKGIAGAFQEWAY